MYRAVKQASDSILGVPSQCFNPKKGYVGEPPRKPRGQYCGNVVRFHFSPNIFSVLEDANGPSSQAYGRHVTRLLCNVAGTESQCKDCWYQCEAAVPAYSHHEESLHGPR